MYKVLLAGAAALAVAGSANAATYAIQAGRLIVDAAQPERGNSTVIVENGRISRIDSDLTSQVLPAPRSGDVRCARSLDVDKQCVEWRVPV